MKYILESNASNFFHIYTNNHNNNFSLKFWNIHFSVWLTFRSPITTQILTNSLFMPVKHGMEYFNVSQHLKFAWITKENIVLCICVKNAKKIQFYPHFHHFNWKRGLFCRFFFSCFFLFKINILGNLGFQL